MKEVYKEFRCQWCKYVFRARAAVTNKGSNQVNCFNCSNIIPTWENYEERERVRNSK